MTIATLGLLRVMLEYPDAPWYGLELSQAARLKTGTIYPILARLEKAAWLTSSWEDADPSVLARPRRRFYRLTGEGEAAARGALNRWMEPDTPPPRSRDEAPGRAPQPHPRSA